MSSRSAYTYNEEYDHTSSEVSKDPPDYGICSDSEVEDNGKKTFRYFDLSSSSSESEEEEDYIEKLKQPEEFLDCNRNDDEDDNIIPLETDDCDFENIKLDSHGQMTCPICEILFKSKIRYVIHRRRHFALDHFICPVCQKGFTKLEQCQAHELTEHKETQEAENFDTSCPRYFFRTRNARKTLVDQEFHVDEDNLVSIFPSTCLYPYDGPPIDDTYQSYQIEVKYGRNERKSHSRIQSKYALECQKKKKMLLEHKLMLVRAREERHKRLERKRRKLLQDQLLQQGRLDDAEEVTHKTVKTAKAHVAAAPPRHILKPTAGSEAKGPKCHFCTLCGFTSDDIDGIKEHGDEYHPEVPVSELIQFLYVDRTCNKDKKEQANDTKKSEDSSSNEKRKLRLREKQTPAQIARAKRLEKLEKLKESRLFRKRRHVPRVWEKEAGSPTFDEFLFALGLRRKEDVLIRPRVTRESLITSKLLRDQAEEVQLDPDENKSIRIPMKRMPLMDTESERGRFYVCQNCEYYSPSKIDVRRHRRAVHLKCLRQHIDVEESLETRVPEDAVVVERRRKSVSSSGNPVAAEVFVQRLDDAIGVRATRSGRVTQPSKKLRIK